MLWLIFTLAAVVLWAAGNISDKFVIDKFVKEPLIPVTIGAVIGALFSILIFLFKGYDSMNLYYIILAIISGGFYMIMGYYYFKAVCIEEISRIIPLFYISNLLIAIFAAIFLGEVLSPIKYLAIVMIIVGAILISVKELKEPKFDKGSFYMLLAAIFTAANMLINKFVLNHAEYWTVYGWNRLGGLLFVLPIVYLYRKQIFPALKTTRKFAFGLMSLSESVNLIAVVFITIATAIGLVTVVTGLSAIQPLVVFIFTVILSILFPRIIKEDIDGKTLTQKFIAIILIVVGAVLLV